MLDLSAREHLTPGQAATVFGHGGDFWRTAFDGGHIGGYRIKRRRYLHREQCRAYLYGLSTHKQKDTTQHSRLRNALREWRNERRSHVLEAV